MRHHFHAQPRAHRHDACFHGAPERIGIAVEMDLVRGGFADELFEHRVRAPVPDDQPPALGREISRERREAAAEKLLPRRAAPMMRAAPFADDIDRHDLRVRGGGVERGIVGEAEVAAEPVDGDHRGRNDQGASANDQGNPNPNVQCPGNCAVDERVMVDWPYWSFLAHWRACSLVIFTLPLIARLSVSSSACSKPPPAGMPCARRVTETGNSRSSPAR